MRTAVFLVLLGGGILAAQGPRGSAPTTTETYRQLAVQRTLELGQCHAELGPLQQLAAQVIAGTVMSTEQFRQQVEKANPGKTLTEAFVITERAALKE